MKFYEQSPVREILDLPLINFPIPAGFPSPAADYVETRIDLNKVLVKNPVFTFYAYCEADSMEPLIHDGDLLIVDRKDDVKDGMIVLAEVNQTFCVKYLYRYPDGSIELRPHNSKYESIHLSCDFEGGFQIFGRVTNTITNLEK